MAEEKDRASVPADAGAPDEVAGTADGQAPSAEGEAPPTQDEARSPEALAAELEEARQQAERYRDQALRAQAECENVRRRASRDVENAHKYALERFTADLLPVLDSLEKAVEVASATKGAESIAEGVELSLKLFLTTAEKYGIQRIDPLGEPFDPQLHEAMTLVPSETAEPNSVVDVMQRGYLLNGRLVRAAKVVVAKAPDAGASNGQ
ncbi:MAG TPA: nucleotide exchange factor GrpE [Pseudomonadales bacterium]